MAEGGVGAYPQVFVVDSQANYVPVPRGGKAKWGVGQKALLLLVGLAVLGLVVEAYLIYTLYLKMEAFSHPFCQNLSNPRASGQQGGTAMSLFERKDSNVIPTVPPRVKETPFAHLIGSEIPVENNVVQWAHKVGEAVTHNMGYRDGRLLVEQDGHYYLYSKMTLSAPVCSLIQHKVMKVTQAYDQPIELMQAKSFHCPGTPETSTARSSDKADLQNSFLAGIFQLQSGDEIYVTLEDKQKIHRGTTENLMGAFMIAPQMNN